MSEERWCHLNGEHAAHQWRSGVMSLGAVYHCPGHAGVADEEETEDG